MHSDIQRGVQMLHAVVQFGRKNPLNPSNARAAFLLGEVEDSAAAIRAMAGAQESARAGFLSRSEERRFIARQIREILRQIALLGKYLPEEHSEVRHKLRVPRSSGYFPLLTHAELFLRFTTPIKAEFLDRGMPADFDVQLRALMERFDAISGDRDSARSRQVGSTAGMKARLKSAVRCVRELNAILTLLLRDDPARFASWRALSHIERAPRRSKAVAEENAVGNATDANHTAVVAARAPSSGGDAPSGDETSSPALSSNAYPQELIAPESGEGEGPAEGIPGSGRGRALNPQRARGGSPTDPQLGLW